jgi:hypothetical protein
MGDETRFEPNDPRRSRFLRWFTDASERALHAPEEHDRLSRSYVAALRIAIARHPKDPRGQELVSRLLRVSPEFPVVGRARRLVAAGR